MNAAKKAEARRFFRCVVLEATLSQEQCARNYAAAGKSRRAITAWQRRRSASTPPLPQQVLCVDCRTHAPAQAGAVPLMTQDEAFGQLERRLE